ncbi:MAG: prepilin-type N-terminal cleavage/methylation domain-containing protein [Candidatus Omnitrophica bacterium]|nr:prepilin-type N-terminal cleavage/methylation domain-containing protein [Candidatus Omnitrophota bacterium]
MGFKSCINHRAFTLLELIVVIIIIGILATVGLSQYNIVIEKGRAGESRPNLASMRKLVYEYYLKNGSLASIVDNDVGVSANGLPNACTSNYFFKYYTYDPTATYVQVVARRCTSGAGGKNPPADREYAITWTIRPGTGADTFSSNYTSDWSVAPY